MGDLPLDNDETKAKLTCCVFLDGISTNTRKMHQVLKALLPPDHLQDVFSRIFAYVDQKVPTLFITADATTKPANGAPTFSFPVTDEGKMRLILELEFTTTKLNQLPGVLPWDFTAMAVLERKLDFKVSHKSVNGDTKAEEKESGDTKAEEKESNEEEPRNPCKMSLAKLFLIYVITETVKLIQSILIYHLSCKR